MLLVKIPYSLGGLDKPGSEKAPDAILKVLKEEVWLSESGRKPFLDVKCVDVKDKDIAAAMGDICSQLKAFNSGVVVGGDHSVTYAAFKAFASHYKNPGLVVFDAHPDCYSEFNFPTHGDWLKALIEEGIVKAENVLVVGLRASTFDENAYYASKKIKTFPMKKLFNNIEVGCDSLMEMARFFDGLYVSIDIDVVDPAFAPGTGYVEPAGMSSRELLYFIQRLKLLKNLKAVDIMEVCPEKDVNGMTVKLAARLIAELQ
ncbi:MAG: arginase family protein [Candidatus Woesearchaeota archaeon]